MICYYGLFLYQQLGLCDPKIFSFMWNFFEAWRAFGLFSFHLTQFSAISNLVKILVCNISLLTVSLVSELGLSQDSLVSLT